MVILVALRVVFGSLRLDEEAEFEGVDLSEHSETAYVFGSASGTPTSHAMAVAEAPALAGVVDRQPTGNPA